MTVQIDESNQYITLINTFTVDPKKQRALTDLLNEATETTMRHLPGFVSATIHESLDGKRVVNYAHWASEADFKKMLGNEEAQEHMKKVLAMAEADPNLYRVVKVHRRP
ncbi:MAG TPA: antibiotic biosynthesis monooxygenase family protein [Thermoanaerobaculia bacterium]|nr:antibiotic biosynthesis monooxygenase family protein [Thermoanaerobaculia bacterium]